MIDLHTHSLLSDGSLLPAELARRAAIKGCRFLAITDHADASLIDFIVPRIARLCRELNRRWDIKVIPGIELTHNPPDDIPRLTQEARDMGAALIVVHGETIVEPVPPGTNHTAIESGIDILAHPGLITPEDCRLAREKGIALELTTRKGHCYANGHVVSLAREYGTTLVINTDTHDPGDLVTRAEAEKTARGAGLDDEGIRKAFQSAELLALKALERMVN